MIKHVNLLFSMTLGVSAVLEWQPLPPHMWSHPHLPAVGADGGSLHRVTCSGFHGSASFRERRGSPELWSYSDTPRCVSLFVLCCC